MAVDRSSRTYTLYKYSIYIHYTILQYTVLQYTVHVVNFRPNWKPIAGCELLPGYAGQGIMGTEGLTQGRELETTMTVARNQPKDTSGVCAHIEVLAQRYLGCVPTQKSAPNIEVCKRNRGGAPYSTSFNMEDCTRYRGLRAITRIVIEILQRCAVCTLLHLIWKIAPGTEVCTRLREL